MIDTLTCWLNKQAADVRMELDNLLAYDPEPEFLLALLESLPVVPNAGLVDLYYDIYYCCRPVFKMAIKQLHSPQELSDFLVLAERALANESDIDAFASACSEESDIDEVIFWLKRHASFRPVASLSRGHRLSAIGDRLDPDAASLISLWRHRTQGRMDS